ncbi:MAG: EAL domain-containing protein [Gammaproteobacteria bacterium]
MLNNISSYKLIVLRILGVAAAYFVGGKLGFSLPYMGSEMTLFWPPAGIAFAAILLWGISCWPGILIGSLALNLTAGELALPAALEIALGHTLGPWAGVWLLKRVTRFRKSLIDGRDIVAFMVTAPVGTAVTASIGMLALSTNAAFQMDSVSSAWLRWWLGDTVGVFIFTPPLLFLAAYLRSQGPQKKGFGWEPAFILSACTALSWIIFGDVLPVSPVNFSFAFILFIPLIWASLRFDALGASLAAMIIALFAVWGTAYGFGPFSSGTLLYDQAALCSFVTAVLLVSWALIGSQSARRHAERALHDVESRLRHALMAGNQGLWDHNAQTGATTVSPEYALMLGYDPSAVEEINDKWRDLIHPDERENVSQIFKDYLAGGLDEYRIEFRQLTRQGDWKWILASGEVVEWDNKGRPFRLLGTYTDISRRKQAEQETKKLRAWLHQIIDATPDWIFVKDPEHRFLLVNQAFANSQGVQPSQMTGRSDTDFWPAHLCHGDQNHGIRGFHAEDDEVITGKVVHHPADQATLADGRLRWFDTLMSPLRDADGDVVGVLAYARDITDRLNAESKYRTLVEQIPAVTYITAMKPVTHTVYVSPQIEAQLGFSVQEWLDDPRLWEKQLHPDDKNRVIAEMTAGLGRESPFHSEYRIYRGDGSLAWVRDYGAWLNDGTGKPILIQGVMLDISKEKSYEDNLNRVMEELRLSERQQSELRTLADREQSRMSALLSAMNIGILFEDNQRRIEYINPAFMRMWGITDQKGLLGKPIRSVLERSPECFVHPILASKYVLGVLDTHEMSERFEIELNDGRVLTQIYYPVTDMEGRVLGRLWIYEDITQDRQTAQQLLYLAERDALTGLYNRHRFHEYLENLIASSIRIHGRFALIYFDLDDFKYINDTFGHHAGDTVLVRAASEITSVIRQIEIFARLGGDEFAILSQIQPGEDISALPSRIVKAISGIPLRFRSTNFRLTSSVGVAIFPDHGETAEDLIAHADAAMYQAKNLGKNTWTIYDPKQDSSKVMVNRMTWHNRIAQAIEYELFEVHYQGVYKTENKTLTHLEAFVRMRDQSDPNNLIMPGQFIPIAEKNGQIITIDRWVLKQCIQLLSRYKDLPPLSVNISRRTFDDPTMTSYLRGLLEDYPINANRLIIELSEPTAVSDIQEAQRFIEAIHQLGCQVCLDDFGSGFSPFGYLKYLDVEILKIDGLFIRDLANNRGNQIFVKAMVDIARGLNKIIVAEFVEDAATWDMVRNLGIDYAQGFYMGRSSSDFLI